MKDYYFILGIGHAAGLSDIKHAYRDLAKQFHPDKNDSPHATLFFREIQEAYEILSDSDTRSSYDEQLLQYYQALLGEENVADSTDARKRKRGKVYTAEQKEAIKKRQEAVSLLYYQRHLRKARVVSLLTFLFSCLIILDYFLPRQTIHEIVLERTDVVSTEHCSFPLQPDVLIDSLWKGTPVLIERTSILKTETLLTLANYPEASNPPSYSIYSVFLFTLIILFVMSLLAVFWRKDPYLVVTFSYINVVFFFLVILFL